MLTTGQILNNRYRIVKLIKQGGFGAVYRAWDLNMNEAVALKESTGASQIAQDQFQFEARLLFKLIHPNVPRVHDLFAIPGQGTYLVMDFVDGEDLETMLEAGGPLPEAEVLEIASQVCDALTYLHSQTPPVIHRDIKPANIKINTEGKAMLVDFGIAKQYDPASSTKTGARAATTGYAPPEQYGKGVTDAQSDVYALGATLYHLLTGQVPPDSLEVLLKSAAKPPPVKSLCPSVSQSTSDAVEKAMRLERKERWSSDRLFKEALISGSKVSAPDKVIPVGKPVGETDDYVPATPTPTPQQSQPWGNLGLIGLLAIIGFSGILAVAGISYVVWKFIGGGTTPTPTNASDTRVPITTTWTPISTKAPTTTVVPSLTPTPNAIEPQPPPTSTLAPVAVKLIQIPAGDFRMGSNSHGPEEQPVHTVYLDAYRMDLTEVTIGMYDECVADGACKQAFLNSNPGPNYPVTGVSWDSAQAYCSWAGGRLPTEAEWEKAARGTDQRQYPWGNDFDGAKLNFCDMNCTALGANLSYDDGYAELSPVGSFLNGASFYGLLDMAGNVWEWVADWYDGAYYSHSPGRNPQGPTSGEGRVIRGGAYDSGATRTTYRDWKAPGLRVADVGFRCASAP